LSVPFLSNDNVDQAIRCDYKVYPFFHLDAVTNAKVMEPTICTGMHAENLLGAGEMIQGKRVARFKPVTEQYPTKGSERGVARVERLPYSA
jgi:hypothetical protein